MPSNERIKVTLSNVKTRTIKFFGLMTALSFERIPVLDSSRKRGICFYFHLPGLLLNLSGRVVNEIKKQKPVLYLDASKEYNS